MKPKTKQQSLKTTQNYKKWTILTPFISDLIKKTGRFFFTKNSSSVSKSESYFDIDQITLYQMVLLKQFHMEYVEFLYFNDFIITCKNMVFS